MCEVNGGAPLCRLRKVLKLGTVVDSDAFENILEMLAILSVECLHCGLYGCFGFAGDLHGDVVVGYSLNESKDNGFLATPQANNRVHLPVTHFGAGIYNSRPRLNTTTFQPLVHAVLSLGTPAFQGIGHFKEG